MAQIHEELRFDEILPRLPAKSLLKFRCVCRQWNSLISSSKFAKTHLNHPSRGSPTSALTIDDNSKSLFTIDYKDSSKLVYDEFGIEFEHPFIWLCSSCNGLALLLTAPVFSLKLYDFDHPEEVLYYDFRFLVGNPVLGSDHFFDIPKLPQELGLVRYKGFCKESFNFGFGYVSSRDDYYIVLVTSPLWRPDFREMFVYVYSLKSGQWILPLEIRQNEPSLVFEERWYEGVGTLVKETLHWGVTLGQNGPKRIAAFDLATQEEVTFMDLPHTNFGAPEEHTSAFRLCCMRGCLCAWERYQSGRLLKMWVMTDYGEQRSWQCLFSYNPGFICSTVIGLNESTAGFILNGEAEEMILTDFSSDPLQVCIHTSIKCKQ